MEMDPLYGQVEEHTSADERDAAQWNMGMECFKEDGEAGQWLPPLSQAGLGQGGDEAGSEQGPPRKLRASVGWERASLRK